MELRGSCGRIKQLRNLWVRALESANPNLLRLDKMGRVQVVLEDKLEELVRKNYVERKGDISRIINEALRDWVKGKKQK